jgi:hypothetical protein
MSRRLRRGLIVAVALGATLAAVLIVLGVAAEAPTRIPAGIAIGGVDVGGLPREEAQQRVADRADVIAQRPLRVIGPRGTIRTTGAALGARPRIEAALDAAGRTRFGRIRDRLGVARPRAVPLTWDVDHEAVSALGERLGPPLPAGDAAVTVTSSGSEVRPGRVGRAVDVDRLAAALVSLPSVVLAPTMALPPRITDAEADAAARRIDLLTGTERILVSGTSRVRLDPATLRLLVEVERQDGELVVGFDADRLARLLPAPTRPRNARLRIRGAAVVVEPAVPGRTVDAAATAARLAASDAATIESVATTTQPDVTTAELAALGIRRRVSQFTTYYPAGQPRVVNITRAAATIDGTILGPGETFSMNDALGERTIEKGYVAAPQIVGSGFGESVGGGISQVATMLYNGAFFAGLELVEHQPHSLYIDRYPLGREATISWGGPELIFRNDWPTAVLIKLDTTETSITVRFFSSPLGRRVETETSAPYGHGGGGFTVEYTRRVYEGERLRRNERYVVRYGTAPAHGR